ncbi:integron integrase [Rhodopirellula baltica]|uniref:Probable integrase/recombinase Y4QK n=1 Tax=Rhodopirellula baltica (strain DSM 10527 / NCIMB 13988 / SH1) TaxID=243090 RepID=Q7UUP7_RHOBA|nr:integron integrase [Rhodopirellula baltica]CAD73032.1 probable integrase/recombinase Y4QK [Rhodopirellula baltica SH 1]
MGTFSKPASAEQKQRWAKIWFQKLCQFHRRKTEPDWKFSADDVIAFLRSRRDAEVPAWKRMKIIEGLIQYRETIQRREVNDLLPLKKKMGEIILIEQAKTGGLDSIDDVVGKINPNEMDAIQEFRRSMRRAGLAIATERCYVRKLKAFMADRGLNCLADFDRIHACDVEAHLTDLAVDGNVSPSTQNQAFHSLLKFFELVLKREMGKIEAIRANKDSMAPTVMSPEEVGQVFEGLEGVYLVIAKLLYGCGMRISETHRLRVKDIDFANKQIEIRQSKGNKSRLVPMPDDLIEPLRRFVKTRDALHEHDLANGTASVYLPYALDRKYPSAHRELKWQYLFASHRLSRDPRTGRIHRHHLRATTFPTHLRRAVEQAGILKHVTSHTFRHCFATHLLWQGTDIRQIQQLLGHSDVKTTEIYTHVRNPHEAKVVSPLDRLVREEVAGIGCARAD